MTNILQKDSSLLREKARDVPVKDITGKKIQSLISLMKSALSVEEDGVAIAAPQVGVSLRIFVVSGKVFDMVKGHSPDKPKTPDSVFINPVIFKISREKNEVEEGCLSVRDIYGRVNRATKVKIKAYNEGGEKFEQGGAGLLAQIFQHETDHLNGILFTDTATNLEHYDHTKIKSDDKVKRKK